MDSLPSVNTYSSLPDIRSSSLFSEVQVVWPLPQQGMVPQFHRSTTYVTNEPENAVCGLQRISDPAARQTNSRKSFQGDSG